MFGTYTQGANTTVYFDVLGNIIDANFSHEFIFWYSRSVFRLQLGRTYSINPKKEQLITYTSPVFHVNHTYGSVFFPLSSVPQTLTILSIVL